MEYLRERENFFALFLSLAKLFWLIRRQIRADNKAFNLLPHCCCCCHVLMQISLLTTTASTYRRRMPVNWIRRWIHAVVWSFQIQLNFCVLIQVEIIICDTFLLSIFLRMISTERCFHDFLVEFLLHFLFIFTWFPAGKAMGNFYTFSSYSHAIINFAG